MLHVVILAAGGSTRFGSAKQLAKIGGETLVRRAARAAAKWPLIIVTGSDHDRVAEELAGVTADIVQNSEWQSGIASSIRAGVARAADRRAEAVLIMLCDQAAITTEDLDRLVASWEGSRESIVAAGYGGVSGVPAIFPRAYFVQLMSLRGDEGARRLIRSAQEIIVVPMPHAAIDIDTTEDAARLRL